MTLGALLAVAAIASATPVSSGPKTDIIYMKNGDRLTCEIKGLTSGALQVSLDYVDGTDLGAVVQGEPASRAPSCSLSASPKGGVYRVPGACTQGPEEARPSR